MAVSMVGLLVLGGSTSAYGEVAIFCGGGGGIISHVTIM